MDISTRYSSLNQAMGFKRQIIHAVSIAVQSRPVGSKIPKEKIINFNKIFFLSCSYGAML